MKKLIIRCKDCNGIIKLSKLDNDKYICKKCNRVYNYKDTDYQTLLNDF